MKTKCTNCQQKYEIDEEWNGQTVTCQNCHREFVVASIQPAMKAVSSSNQQNVVQTNVKQGAVIGAAVCLILAIAIQCASNLFFIFYFALYVVSFILSIVAMAQRRVLWGIIILLATISAPCIVLYATYQKDADMIKNAIKEAHIQAEKELNKTNQGEKK